MTTDLWMLVASAGLAWIAILTPATRNFLVYGMGYAFGNRGEQREASELGDRAKRASDNLMENLPLFTILVLVVHVSGKSNDMSALGAIVFFAARCAHFVIYLAGIKLIRTVVWAVSIAGMAMVATALLG